MQATTPLAQIFFLSRQALFFLLNPFSHHHKCLMRKDFRAYVFYKTAIISEAHEEIHKIGFTIQSKPFP